MGLSVSLSLSLSLCIVMDKGGRLDKAGRPLDWDHHGR